MVFFIVLLLAVDSLFARPIQLIDRKNRTIDILNQLTGYQGPYTFDCLKWRGGKPFVYKVEYANKACIVRFNQDYYKPARVDEIAVHRYAQAQGFGPEVIYADEDEGIIVMEFLSGTQPIKAFDRKKQIDLLIELVKKIHVSRLVCRPKDSFVVNVFDWLSHALKKNHYGINLFAFQESLKFLEQCIDLSVKPVFVHGDLTCDNIFLCGDSYKAIDFEGACYDHPYVDLARLAVFFGFDQSEETYFLQRYWNREIIQQDLYQFAIFKLFNLASFVLGILETLDDDFLESKEYQEMFYVKPLTDFLQDPIEDKVPAWRYRAAILALKEAEKLLVFLQDSFK
jgi:thiamine kinase-like enzyme